MSAFPGDHSLSQLSDKLYSAVVSDALDQAGLCHQSPSVDLQPLTTAGVLVGRCRTTLWEDIYHTDPTPYELELKAVDACRPGEVLVAAAHGSMRSAIWGELLSTACQVRGCVGAIVDGATRDVAKLREMQFPVFARGTRVLDSRDRQRVTDIDVTVEIGGVRFESGDLVIADADGIVVVPSEVEHAVVEHAWNKVHAENQVRDAIRGGLAATAAFERFGVL